MSSIKSQYGSTTLITATLASLASAAAREATAVDNTTDLFIDVMVTLAIALQTGTPTGQAAINVWFAESGDGTIYTDPVTGSNAAITLRTPSNLRGPFVIATPTAGALTYKAVIGSVAQYFGGILPPKWSIVIENQTGLALDATEGNHTKSYRGVYGQNA